MEGALPRLKLELLQHSGRRAAVWRALGNCAVVAGRVQGDAKRGADRSREAVVGEMETDDDALRVVGDRPRPRVCGHAVPGPTLLAVDRGDVVPTQCRPAGRSSTALLPAPIANRSGERGMRGGTARHTVPRCHAGVGDQPIGIPLPRRPPGRQVEGAQRVLDLTGRDVRGERGWCGRRGGRGRGWWRWKRRRGGRRGRGRRWRPRGRQRRWQVWRGAPRRGGRRGGLEGWQWGRRRLTRRRARRRRVQWRWEGWWWRAGWR